MTATPPKQILVVVRRLNGDVLLASPLLAQLRQHFPHVAIDLLVNRNTVGIAHALPEVREVMVYPQAWRRLRLWQYDWALSLTATDSSVLYARLAGKRAASEIDAEPHKNWWKRLLLNGHYQRDPSRHTVLHNLQALAAMGLAPQGRLEVTVQHTARDLQAVQARLQAAGIGRFVIFHPATQQGYKMYPAPLRHALLEQLAAAGVTLVMTGADAPLDRAAQATLPRHPRIHDWIGRTSLGEYIALSQLAAGYIGGDTLNMHVAAAQGKRVFAIFGPTLLPVWSPWSNALQHAATYSQPEQTYGNITVFQADLPCVPCGKAGCHDDHGESRCLSHIPPERIAAAVLAWWRGLPP